MRLDWVDEACARLCAPGATPAGLAAWARGDDTPGDSADEVFVAGPARLGAAHALILADAGAPSALIAGYARGTGPTEAEAAAALGPARELPHGPGGPFRIAFPVRPGCFVAATTYDPPGGERRLSDLTFRRDG